MFKAGDRIYNCKPIPVTGSDRPWIEDRYEFIFISGEVNMNITLRPLEDIKITTSEKLHDKKELIRLMQFDPETFKLVEPVPSENYCRLNLIGD